MIAIRTVQGELSAHLVKSRLESVGIPVMLQYETYFNLILSIHAPIVISVPVEFADEARELVADKSYDMITNVSKKWLWVYGLIYIAMRVF